MSFCKALLFFLLINGIAGTAFSQSAKGSWYGVGHIQMDGNSENYLTELIIKEEGNNIKGEFNYYFRDSLFKNKIKCSFNKKTRLLVIQKFPIIYYRSISTKKAVMCDVMGMFELRVAKTGSVINGSLTTTTANAFLMPVINYRLIKDTVPAAKTIPAPKQKMQVPTPSISIQAQKNKAKIATQSISPVLLQPSKTAPNIKVTDSLQKTVLKTKGSDSSIKKSNSSDSLIKKPAIVLDTVKPKKLIAPNPAPTPVAVAVPAAIPAAVITEKAFTERKKEYAKIIEVENSKIRLEVYDNGTIDYDSVSLLLNGKLVLPKTMLNHHSVKLYIELDLSLEFNELGMFAENLGLIPPNTASLIIRDGKKTYEFTLNSDFTKSAIIQLKTNKINKKD